MKFACIDQRGRTSAVYAKTSREAAAKTLGDSNPLFASGDARKKQGATYIGNPDPEGKPQRCKVWID